MTRRKREDLREVPQQLLDKVRPPVGVVLGSPSEVEYLVETLEVPEVVCFQLDLYPAGRVQELLGDRVRVEAAPDLWDLSSPVQTLIYLPAQGGERELKLDMVEQAFHVLRPHGVFMVWSPYQEEELFPGVIKKVFGRVHSYPTDSGTLLTAHRDGERARRRHEVTFQAKIQNGPSCQFVSRPGTFSYGRFDNGARALMEVAEISEGNRVLDLGCGCGTNGIFAWQRCGPTGHVTFVDSNLRALALTEINAKANGVTSFDVVATPRVEGLTEESYHVILANPPYFAQSAISRLFIERGRELLHPDGRFFLVTRQPNEAAQMIVDTFGNVEAAECRGYVVLSA